MVAIVLSRPGALESDFTSAVGGVKHMMCHQAGPSSGIFCGAGLTNATLFLWHDLSQRECVGKMVGKQMCKSATVSNLCAIQHSPSVWAPKLTATLTVARKKILS